MTVLYAEPLPGAVAKKPAADHVDRLTNRYFGHSAGELLVGGLRISEVAETFGTPSFVYDRGVIAEKLREIRSTLPDRFSVYYSMKANPNRYLLECFLAEGCGLEVASAGELRQALAAGCAPSRVLFAGPGKTEAELAAAIEAGIKEIHVEAIDEAITADRLAGAAGKTVDIALRINPVDSSGGAMRMGGKASPFGIDEEDLDVAITEISALQNVTISGVHLFMGTQILDAETLIGQYRRAVELAKQVAVRAGPLKTIDFGGGWGTPCFANETPLDLKQVAEGMQEIDDLLAADPGLANAEAIIEPGRFLINEAGLYMCRVLRVKQSRGKTFAIIDGGMHHHLAASGNLGQTIKRNYPIALIGKLNEPAANEIEIVGPLCTPLDTLGRNVSLPDIEAGDLIGIFMSGAYARTASPTGFLSHDTPAEILVDDGQAKLVSFRRQAHRG